MYTATTSTHKLLKLDKRLRVVAGGTSAGKTISILQILIHYAQTHNSELISVVSESFPHLRRGAMRDFLNIMHTHHYFKDERWSKTDYTYTFETGSKIEFFSADQPGKVRGPRREVLYINEANNIPFEAYDQLAIRTRKTIWMDFNPTNEFWYYTEVAPHYDHDFITLTYKDNEALDKSIVESIEAHRHNKEWWKVYGLGQLGEVESRIFKGWKLIDEIPHEARLEVGGGDFGFARDRTAFCDIYRYNGGFIIDQIVSRVKLQDSDLATMLMNRPNPNLLYTVDSADSQKVLLLQQMGVNVTGVVKRGSGGEHFTNAAIGFVQNQQISLTKRSTDYIKSYRNFMWQTDKDGKIIPKYDHFNSDEMMSVVYGMTMFSPREEESIEYTTGNAASLWY
jgi:phage terminase large subunit